MVPSATNTLRYHGLSQNHTNEQSGFKAETGYIPESKLISVETHPKTMNLPSINQTTKMSKVKRFKDNAPLKDIEGTPSRSKSIIDYISKLSQILRLTDGNKPSLHSCPVPNNSAGFFLT